MCLAKCHFQSKGKMVLSPQANDSCIDSSYTLKISVMSCCNLSHLHWMCISHFPHVMALLCIFKSISKVSSQTMRPWHVMSIQTISKYHSWDVAKIPTQKFTLFHKLDNFAPGSLTVHLKFDFLHWPFLMKSNYAPWKYMSNRVCA
jgi:hypothetical protein